MRARERFKEAAQEWKLSKISDNEKKEFIRERIPILIRDYPDMTVEERYEEAAKKWEEWEKIIN